MRDVVFFSLTGLLVPLPDFFFCAGEDAGFLLMLLRNHARAMLLGEGGVLLLVCILGDRGKKEKVSTSVDGAGL